MNRICNHSSHSQTGLLLMLGRYHYLEVTTARKGIFVHPVAPVTRRFLNACGFKPKAVKKRMFCSETRFVPDATTA